MSFPPHIHTYADLYPYLSTIPHASTDLIDRLESIVHRLVNLRSAMQAELLDFRYGCGDGGNEMFPWVMQILELLQDVEEMGVEGWVAWADQVERRELEDYERYLRDREREEVERYGGYVRDWEGGNGNAEHKL